MQPQRLVTALQQGRAEGLALIRPALERRQGALVPAGEQLGELRRAHVRPNALLVGQQAAAQFVAEGAVTGPAGIQGDDVVVLKDGGAGAAQHVEQEAEIRGGRGGAARL